MQQNVVAEVAKEVKKYRIPQIKLSYVADRQAEAKYGEPLLGSEKVADMLRDWWDEDSLTYTESMVAVLLNRRYKAIGILPISEGSGDACIFDVRKLSVGALIANASSIILAHNHPSGNLRPSPQDDTVTKKAKTAMEALGIRFLDHIILTDEGYFSYMEAGKLF